MKVGIFDSGIGGLSVLHRARKYLPSVDFIYYADEKHVPYGEKSPEQIRGYLNEIFSFMLDKKVDAIVVACNTATSALTRSFRESFPVPVIGMEPAVKRAVDLYGEQRMIVAATPVTLNGEKLRLLLNRYAGGNDVVLLPLPKLVRYAEAGEFESPEVKKYLEEKFDKCGKCDTLVLGCTHFNYFKPYYKSLLGDEVHLVDGNDGTVRRMISLLDLNTAGSGEGRAEYFYSGVPVSNAQSEHIKKCIAKLDEVYNIE